MMQGALIEGGRAASVSGSHLAVNRSDCAVSPRVMHSPVQCKASDCSNKKRRRVECKPEPRGFFFRFA